MKYLHLLPLVFLFIACKPSTNLESKTQLYTYDIENRVEELGIQLPEVKLPSNIPIATAVRVDDMIYLSGSGPRDVKGERILGKVGKDLTIDEGYAAARSIAANHLSVLQSELGDLNKVVQVVKVLGMVNAPDDFTQHPAVINGYSDLMIEVFGERGKHARSAVGMGSLPFDMACEIEAIIQVQD